MASVDFLSILFLVIEPQLQTHGERIPRDSSGDDQQNCRIPVTSNLTTATGSPSPGLYQRQLPYSATVGIQVLHSEEEMEPFVVFVPHDLK